MGELSEFRKSYWGDLRDFWKSQLVVGIILLVITAILNWWLRKNLPALYDRWWEGLIPYALIILLFLAGNAIRTVYRSEKREFKKKEYLAQRHLAEEVKRQARESEAAQTPNPNLLFRRIYQKEVYVGHAISGNSYSACLVEMGNEVGENVGHARNVRAQITYKATKTSAVLHTECPAMWSRENEPVISIPVGEGRSFVLAAYDRPQQGWSTAIHGGMNLRGSFDVQAKILSPDGRSISETLNFIFSWDGGYGAPSFKRV